MSDGAWVCIPASGVPNCVFSNTVLCFLLESQVQCSFCWIQVLEPLDFLLFETSVSKVSSASSYSLGTILNKFDSSLIFLTTLIYSLVNLSYFQSYFLAWNCAFLYFQLFWPYQAIQTRKLGSPRPVYKIQLKVPLKKRKRKVQTLAIFHTN